jgi:rhodanese-related sulfurtransferase
MRKWILLFALTACSEKKSDYLLSPQEFDSKYRATEEAILLDVRTVEEVSAGTLAGAVNIVYDADFADKLENLEHKPIFIYCGSGIRSAKAARILKEKGYESIYELDGGIKSWKEAGMPIER